MYRSYNMRDRDTEIMSFKACEIKKYWWIKKKVCLLYNYRMLSSYWEIFSSIPFSLCGTQTNICKLIQVTAALSLAAACSSAGVTVLFARDTDFCKAYPQFSCGRYQISTTMAFITWLLVATSSLVMFWILTSA